MSEPGERADAGASHPLDPAEAQSWHGFRIDDLTGSAAGKVDGVLVDAGTGEPVWLVNRVSRLGKRSVVPFDLAAPAAGHVWVPFERELIRSAPTLDPSRGLTREQELELCAHFGLSGPSGRASALEESGDGESPTAIPAG